MITVIIFLVVLAVLIFVHELGHFLAARISGIRVDEFKIGFGPHIVSWGKGETKYGLNLIPFGGFVKIFGENPDDENTNGPDKARSFVHKKKWQQVMVLVAGVVFNFLFAWLIYFCILAVGGTVPTSAFPNYTQYLSNHKVIVLDAEADSPAIRAGLGIGDVLDSVLVNSQNVRIVSSQDAMNAINSSGGSPIVLTYEHGKERTSVAIIPTKGIVEGRYAIGISMDEIAEIHMPILKVPWASFTYTLATIRDTAVGLWQFLIGLFTRTTGLSDVTGPVGIAVIIGNAAHLTLSYLLIVVALISVNLGVVNLIPFPALDGGRTLFVIIEAITRRRIPATFTTWVNVVGFFLLMALMVFVTYKDIVRLIV